MNHDPNLWSKVFSDRNALLAFLGAMGGLTRSLALKTSWIEGLRVTIIGAIFAAGVGAIAPVLLRPWLGDLPDDCSQHSGPLARSHSYQGLWL